MASIAIAEQHQFTMLIGPGQSAQLLEVGVVADDDNDNDYVIHAMPARPKYLRMIRPNRSDQP